jgi:hypothetical protein
MPTAPPDSCLGNDFSSGGDYIDFTGKSDKFTRALTNEFATLRVNNQFSRTFEARYPYDADLFRDADGQIAFERVWADELAMPRVEPPVIPQDEDDTDDEWLKGLD